MLPNISRLVRYSTMFTMSLIVALTACRPTITDINGLENGLIVQEIPDSRKLRVIKFRKEAGKIVFSPAISLQLPPLSDICPTDPQPGNPDPCSCDMEEVNGFQSCFDLVLRCNGTIHSRDGVELECEGEVN